MKDQRGRWITWVAMCMQLLIEHIEDGKAMWDQRLASQPRSLNKRYEKGNTGCCYYFAELRLGLLIVPFLQSKGEVHTVFRHPMNTPF